MASGAAVPGAAQMSIGELLGVCRSGIALEQATPASVAEAWLELLRPGRAALLGARGRVEVEQRYSWRATFSRIVQVYQQVLAESGGSRRLTAAVTPLLEQDTPPAADDQDLPEERLHR
ncbi:MAG: hypothetical protein HY902_05945 [Deltaproteobacteria bacterium]|nr:hypothetical protein [Deltaproteobacteria bacterium]